MSRRRMSPRWEPYTMADGTEVDSLIFPAPAWLARQERVRRDMARAGRRAARRTHSTRGLELIEKVEAAPAPEGGETDG